MVELLFLKDNKVLASSLKLDMQIREMENIIRAGKKCRKEADWELGGNAEMRLNGQPSHLLHRPWGCWVVHTHQQHGAQHLGVVLATPSGKAFASYEHHWHDVEQVSVCTCFLGHPKDEVSQQGWGTKHRAQLPWRAQ